MRYELADSEWTAINPLLPNKPRGVYDRRILNASLDPEIERTVARFRIGSEPLSVTRRVGRTSRQGGS